MMRKGLQAVESRCLSAMLRMIYGIMVITIIVREDKKETLWNVNVHD